MLELAGEELEHAEHVDDAADRDMTVDRSYAHPPSARCPMHAACWPSRIFPATKRCCPAQSRASLLMERILAIPEAEVTALNAAILQRFDGRHRRLRRACSTAISRLVAHHVADAAAVSADRRLLIGAYFTHEYAIEAAALFNPSIVPAPDQTRRRERRDSAS